MDDVHLQGEEEVEVEDMDEQHVQGEEEVVIEDFTSNKDDDVGEVHGEVREGVIDEGQMNEGLVDVDVHINELLDNNIERSMSVEVNVNEENRDLEINYSAYSYKKSNDK
ncbi:hypothetical protein V8G54_027208, partial [Vigna mungo]